MADPATDPQLRELLMIARSWGVSPSRFAGREPQRVTVHEYDSGGALIRSVETTEPEWTHEDRVLATQLHEYESALCRGCGNPLHETTAPENEFAYKAMDPIRCHRCTVSQVAGEKYQESVAPSALMIPVVLRGTETHADHLST
jgi:hypothetical protein